LHAQQVNASLEQTSASLDRPARYAVPHRMPSAHKRAGARLLQFLRQQDARAAPVGVKVHYERPVALLDSHLELLCVQRVNLRSAGVLVSNSHTPRSSSAASDGTMAGQTRPLPMLHTLFSACRRAARCSAGRRLCGCSASTEPRRAKRVLCTERRCAGRHERAACLHVQAWTLLRRPASACCMATRCRMLLEGPALRMA